MLTDNDNARLDPTGSVVVCSVKPVKKRPSEDSCWDIDREEGTRAESDSGKGAVFGRVIKTLDKR